MITIPEFEEIAQEATKRIAQEFEECGFANPPKVTPGIVRAVLEAAQQGVQADGGVCTCEGGVSDPEDNHLCGVCGLPHRR
jgi:hypothetical protein